MSERKNIDRLFQEKFKDFEADPSEQSWINIESRLEEKKKRKVIPLWFKMGGVAALLLIGLLLTFKPFSGKQPFDPAVVQGPGAKPETVETPDLTPAVAAPETSSAKASEPEAVTVVEPRQGEAKAKANPNAQNSVNNNGSMGSNASGIRQQDEGVAVYPLRKSSVKPSKATKPGISGNEAGDGFVSGREGRYASADHPSKASGNRNNTSVPQKTSQANGASTDLENNENPHPLKTNSLAINENNQSGRTAQHNNNNSGLTETTTSTQAAPAETEANKTDSTAIATVDEPNALEELQHEKEKSSVTQNGPKLNRWQITSNVAPIYFSSTSEGSPIDSRFTSNDKEYKTKFSYGMGVNYALNKRLSIRAGVNSIALEYNTTGVEFSQDVNARQLEHVNTNLQGSMLDIRSKGTGTSTSAPIVGLNGNINPKFEGSLNQKTGYIEVPVELAYKLLDKKFGIEVVGGFSTLFLNQNEVSLLSSDSEMYIGKANNLNETHFSTNLGVGFKYDILKALQANLQPMFKYQINTFTDSGNFKPFFFGLYTGLNYRF